MKKTFLSFLIFLGLFINIFADTNITVNRHRTYLRNGPGSYYGIICELPVDSTYQVLETVGSWYKIGFQDSSGFSSSRAFMEAGKKQSMFATLASQDNSDLSISRHGMSAGVKGFAEKMSEQMDGSHELISYILSKNINPKEYNKFKKSSKKKYKIKSNRKNDIPVSKSPTYFTGLEEGLGLAIASAVASMGIWENDEWSNYINYVGNMIVENTEMYDIQFRFFILDIEDYNAFALPGGFVFISRGLLNILKSEAQLACVLGHEITHVTHFHGLLEMEQRKHHISAENAFAELDDELPDKPDDKFSQTEKELENEAFQIYEKLFHGRLDSYEEEADKIGLIYASRTGYNPNDLKELLNILQISNINNEHFKPENIAKRSNQIDDVLDNMKLPRNLKSNETRINEMKNKFPIY